MVGNHFRLCRVAERAGLAQHVCGLTVELRSGLRRQRCVGRLLQQHVTKAERAAGALKREIASRIKLRRMPNLRFHFDDMLEEERRIGEILQGLQKEQSDEADAS